MNIIISYDNKIKLGDMFTEHFSTLSDKEIVDFLWDLYNDNYLGYFSAIDINDISINTDKDRYGDTINKIYINRSYK